MAERENKEKVNIVFDKRRALEVFKILFNAWETRHFRFLDPNELPQNKKLPVSIERGSLEHQLFLFFSAIGMRAGINSDYVFECLETLYDNPKWRRIFQPEDFPIKTDSSWVELALNNSGLEYKSDSIAKSWESNALNLVKYDYIPALIFKGLKTQQDIWEKFIGNGFSGWKEKIVSLLSLWFQEVDWIDSIYGAPPFDFHAMRILINTKAIQFFNEAGDEIYPAIRAGKIIGSVLSKIDALCVEEEIAPVNLSAALWLLSRNACKLYPTSSKYCPECPLADYCQSFIHYYNKKDGKIYVFSKEKPAKQLLLAF